MSRSRVLLMYISQVSGHRSAAQAIDNEIKKLSPDAQVLSINAFNYTNPVSEKVINRLYMEVVNKAPKIWDYLYDNPKVVERIAKIKDTVHKFNSPKLKKLFDEFRPDVVACTQAFPCGMVADYKKTYNSSIPLVAVLTDYVPHSYWIYDLVDYYIAPSDEVKVRMQQKGIPDKKIKTFGIPFDSKFNSPVERAEVLRRMGFDAELPVVLIMGGGHGLGPIKTIVKSLEKTKQPLQEIIITGINNKLFRSIQKTVKGFKKRITVLGFADNINELMSAADLLITKPGGITTAEALVKKIPMIIIKPIPGQEASNTAYLTEKKAAIEIDNLKEINLAVDELFLDRAKLDLMRAAALAIAKPHAASDIARLIIDPDYV